MKGLRKLFWESAAVCAAVSFSPMLLAVGYAGVRGVSQAGEVALGSDVSKMMSAFTSASIYALIYVPLAAAFNVPALVVLVPLGIVVAVVYFVVQGIRRLFF